MPHTPPAAPDPAAAPAVGRPADGPAATRPADALAAGRPAGGPGAGRARAGDPGRGGRASSETAPCGRGRAALAWRLAGAVTVIAAVLIAIGQSGPGGRWGALGMALAGIVLLWSADPA